MGLRGRGATTRRSLATVPAEPAAWQAKGLSRPERVIAFCEGLPVTKGILAGQRMELLPHQKAFIRAVYAKHSPVRLAIQSLARGNGKTGFLASLALCHLLGPEAESRGEVYVAASSRDQAAGLFHDVTATIEAEPRLLGQVNIQRFVKIIEVMGGPAKGSRFETLSSDVRRGHGLSPTLWIYDELAQARNSELLDNLRTAQGKRKRSLGCVISTQSSRDEHPLSILIDDALRGDDSSIFLQLLAASADDDPFSEDTWKRVNPALRRFLDLKEFRAQAEQAKRIPTFKARFLNLRLNMRIDAEDRWIGPDVWAACAGDVDLEALAGQRCFGGLDLSSTRDLTAFSLYWPTTGCLVVWCWCPAERADLREHQDRVPYRQWAQAGHLELVPGRALDTRHIALRLGELYQRYRPISIGFDRWGMPPLEAALAQEGISLPLEPFGQGFRDLAPAVKAFDERVLSQTLVHDGGPVLTWAIGNVVLELDAAGNAKPSKRRAIDRIDPVLAAMMAVGTAAKAGNDTITHPFVLRV